MTSLIDLDRDPDVQNRLDSYHVPAGARAEFEADVKRSVVFLETLPGFRAHLALAKTSGPSAFNIAVWQSGEAMANAIRQVKAHYDSIGAIGLLLPVTRHWAAIGPIVLLLAMLPANISAANRRILLRGRPPMSPWLRIPMQALFIGWAWVVR
jgi:hypothetical protein